jgi:predicted Zn-dependent protease
MRFPAGGRLVPGATLTLLLLAALLPAAESTDSVKGIVERVEGGRFLTDSAWVEPVKGAHFSGTANKVGKIRPGEWADVDGRWSGGVLQAERIKISHDFPGHTFQQNLSHQGLAEAGKLVKSPQAYHDPEVETYVSNIGMSVVPEWAKKEFHFQFNILSDPTLNAFALPDGSIFVHTGLLARVENDSQLAAILGHETAHVTEHHGAQGYKKQMTTFLPAAVGAEVLGMKMSDKGQNPFVAMATQAGLTLAMSAAVSGYGRTHEDQADRVGLRYAVEAGYDPTPAPRVWEIFNETYGDESKLENFFYGNHSTNSVRKGNQVREIQRHYSDPASLHITRPVNEEGYQVAMLSLTRQNAILDFDAKRTKLAASGFQRVLKHRKGDAPSHTYLGRIALIPAQDQPPRLGDAEVQFRAAVQSDPAYPDAHRELGRLLSSQKKGPEARQELKRYLELAPADAKDRKDVEAELRKIS